jgi:murein DD-endopeptidase MepM/ murein hydrolase activator NlpD
MRARTAIAALLVLGALGAMPAAAATESAKTTAEARAFAVRVVLPDGTEDVLAEAGAPPAQQATSGSLTYGSGAVTTGAVWSRASAVAAAKANAWATSTVRTVSLFGGEITIGAVSTKAVSQASPTRASGALDGSWLAKVTILGAPVRATRNARVPLADWGYAVLLEQAVQQDAAPRIGRKTFVAALHVHLTAAHGGFPAGTELFVGYAEAKASAEKPKPAVQTSPPPPPAAPATTPPRDPQPSAHGNPPSKPPPIVQAPPPNVKPKLTTKGYVFPVYGPASFTDDFAAARAETGWHHGNDIFAPVGAPILAITDGTLFLVGWNALGGNRVWLRDQQGNEFYYAHMSAFSPLAYNGARVQAGDVIGFVGATGDAVGTPSHLHFEVHPAALLGLGYDGVVDPYTYLLAWRRVADASYDWGTPQAGEAPPPSVVPLESVDIASASGLDPAELARRLELPALLGEPGAAIAPGLIGADAGG